MTKGYRIRDAVEVIVKTNSTLKLTTKTMRSVEYPVFENASAMQGGFLKAAANYKTSKRMIMWYFKKSDDQMMPSVLTSPPQLGC